jgi:hypothetical protein
VPRFTTPTVKERYGRHRLFSRVSIDVGVTILRITGNQFVQVRDPSPEEITAAEAAYVGGRTYEVSEEEANRLILAGYGDHVEL